MSIRAKMKCCKVQREGECEYVKLQPVYSEDPASENHQWAKYTPAGELTLTITNASAQGQIEEGKEYFVDLTLVR